MLKYPHFYETGDTFRVTPYEHLYKTAQVQNQTQQQALEIISENGNQLGEEFIKFIKEDREQISEKYQQLDEIENKLKDKIKKLSDDDVLSAQKEFIQKMKKNCDNQFNLEQNIHQKILIQMQHKQVCCQFRHQELKNQVQCYKDQYQSTLHEQIKLFSTEISTLDSEMTLLRQERERANEKLEYLMMELQVGSQELIQQEIKTRKKQEYTLHFVLELAVEKVAEVALRE